MDEILSLIDSPEDLRKLPLSDLTKLAEEIRALIEPIVVDEEAAEEKRPEITVEMPADMTELAPELEESDLPEPMGSEVVPLPGVPQ